MCIRDRPAILADAVHKAMRDGCRIVVEHFELLYPVLKQNADVLVGIGEEVIIARPSLFGPLPEEIKSIVYESLYHRKMAHSAEDITQMVLQRMGVPKADGHDDVRHGFILCYLKQPKVDLALVDEPVSYTHLALTEADISESTYLVAQMGMEPFINALDNGADVILAGRSYDPAVFAAYAVWKGYPTGLLSLIHI